MPYTGPLSLPSLACDTHSHIYGDPKRYPLDAGRRYEEDARLEDYLRHVGGLGVERYAIVQASAYGTDPQCLLDAISTLGIHRSRGVIMPDPRLNAAELSRLHQAGIRGVRYLYPKGTAINTADIRLMSGKIAALGWGLIVQGDGRALAASIDGLIGLPTPVVIDHLGRLAPGTALDSPECRAVLRFLESGGWIKLSAPYYGTPDGAADFGALSSRVHAFLDAAPDRAIWGVNWPHLSFTAHHKPDDAATLASLLSVLRSDAEKQAVFVDNPARLYGFS